jgi:hypothetical protein
VGGMIDFVGPFCNFCLANSLRLSALCVEICDYVGSCDPSQRFGETSLCIEHEIPFWRGQLRRVTAEAAGYQHGESCSRKTRRRSSGRWQAVNIERKPAKAGLCAFGRVSLA